MDKKIIIVILLFAFIIIVIACYNSNKQCGSTKDNYSLMGSDVDIGYSNLPCYDENNVRYRMGGFISGTQVERDLMSLKKNCCGNVIANDDISYANELLLDLMGNTENVKEINSMDLNANLDNIYISVEKDFPQNSPNKVWEMSKPLDTCATWPSQNYENNRGDSELDIYGPCGKKSSYDYSNKLDDKPKRENFYFDFFGDDYNEYPDVFPLYKYFNSSDANNIASIQSVHPELFNSLYFFYPGFSIGTGWKYLLRGGIKKDRYKNGSWLKNNGNYYFINNL